jgi:hypothetical protein
MRNQLDLYETAPFQTLALLDYTPFPIAGNVFCPTAGPGAIVEVLQAERPDLAIRTNDLNEEYPTDFHFDACNGALYPDDIDWVIDNPPYTQAEAIARNCLEHARVGVALLLRSTWRELIASRRGLITAPNAPTCINLSRRYCFRKGEKSGRWQADFASHWWFLWHKETPRKCTTLIDTPHNLRCFTKNPDETREMFPQGYKAWKLGAGLDCTEVVSDRHIQPALWCA